MGRSIAYLVAILVVVTSVQSAYAQRRPRPTTPEPQTTTTTAPTPPPDTENDTLARNHFESGRAYFSQAQYDDAAREFAEAYRLSHRAQLLLNVARALEEGDREEEAVTRLDEWLAQAPVDDPARPEVEQRRARLVVEAARRAQQQTQQTPQTTEAAPESASTDSGPSALFITGIAAVGFSGVAGGIALGTGIAAHNTHQDLDAVCDDAGNCPASASGDISRGQALARASTAMTFIGIAAAGTGVALMLVGRHHDEAPPVAFIPWIAPPVEQGASGAGATLQLSF